MREAMGGFVVSDTSQQDAFVDLAAIADWSGGNGNCGCWSMRSLGARWGWHSEKVRRFLQHAVAVGLIRLNRRVTGTHVILLNDKWFFFKDTLPRVSIRPIDHAEQIALTVVSTYYDVAESHIRRLLHSRTRRRGRPSRAQCDQDAVSIWIYLLNTSGGFSAQQIRNRTGLHRRAIQHTAALMEDQRDVSPELDAVLTSMEAAYRAAEKIINRVQR